MEGHGEDTAGQSGCWGCGRSRLLEDLEGTPTPTLVEIDFLNTLRWQKRHSLAVTQTVLSHTDRHTHHMVRLPYTQASHTGACLTGCPQAPPRVMHRLVPGSPLTYGMHTVNKITCNFDMFLRMQLLKHFGRKITAFKYRRNQAPIGTDTEHLTQGKWC